MNQVYYSTALAIYFTYAHVVTKLYIHCAHKDVLSTTLSKSIGNCVNCLTAAFSLVPGFLRTTMESGVSSGSCLIMAETLWWLLQCTTV